MIRYIMLILLLQLFFSCQNHDKPQTSFTEREDTLSPYTSAEGSRQIHLDFHNSEHLENIGVEFDKEQFVNALKKANVNSINIFAKCHHGWSYYDTDYGKMHPHLSFDLLKAQVDACKEAGIRVQAYFTIGWSVNDALEHPEWIILDKDGKSSSNHKVHKLGKDDPFPTFTWDLLSPEGSYLDLILAQTEELVSKYDLDGLWYDIIPLGSSNYQKSSIAEMQSNGVDIQDEEAVNRHHVEKMEHFMQACNDMVKKHKPEASIFYNWSTHVRLENTFKYHTYRYNTKLDLEDLPTTWEGYDIFPLRAKYFSNTGMSLTGMSGKFHTAWGEFGGFKYPEALKFEAASMVAMGANVNLGDQLHPGGKMDEETYKNLKPAFDYVAEIEAYGIGGQHHADLGIWMSFKGKSDEGLARMLLENQINFVVANNHSDIQNLKVIILSSATELAEQDVKRLQKYLDDGGSLILMGKSGLNAAHDFIFDAGLTYVGEAQYDVDYTVAFEQVGENIVNAPFLNYTPALRTEVMDGTEILASIHEPYFSRTKQHYTSHQNTPYQLEKSSHPGISRKGNVMFIAHELDKIYYENGSRIHRELFVNTLMQMYQEPMLKVDMPSGGRVNLLHFPDRRQYVLHLLYGPPLQRGRAQVIEDLVPLYDVQVQFNPGVSINKVYEIPANQELKFETSQIGIKLILPKLQMHTGIVMEY